MALPRALVHSRVCSWTWWTLPCVVGDSSALHPALHLHPLTSGTAPGPVGFDAFELPPAAPWLVASAGSTDRLFGGTSPGSAALPAMSHCKMLRSPISLCVEPALVHLVSAHEELVLERAPCCACLSPRCCWSCWAVAPWPDLWHTSTSAGVALELLSPLCSWQV